MMDMEKQDKDCTDDKYGQKGKYYDYQIKDAARTLTKAEEIKDDKEILKYVIKCVEEDSKKAKKAFSSIKEIREHAGRKRDEEEEEEKEEKA